jgi:nitrate reductase NapE component
VHLAWATRLVGDLSAMETMCAAPEGVTWVSFGWLLLLLFPVLSVSLLLRGRRGVVVKRRSWLGLVKLGRGNGSLLGVKGVGDRPVCAHRG